jgi:radical SAM-linked protein
MFPRIGRRAKLPLYYTEGFSPRPVMTFGPALGLGQRSLGEYLEFSLDGQYSADDVLGRLNRSTPAGLVFTGLRRIEGKAPELAEAIAETRMLLTIGHDTARQLTGDNDVSAWLAGRIAAVRNAPDTTVVVERKQKQSERRFWDIVLDVSVCRSGLPALLVRLRHDNGPSLRAAEILSTLCGTPTEPNDIVRTWLGSSNEAGEVDPLVHGLGEQDELVEIPLAVAIAAQADAAAERARSVAAQ